MADDQTTQEEIKPEETTEEETVPAEETAPEAPEEQPEEKVVPEAKAEEKPKPKTAKLSKKLEDLASDIEKLSVLELSDLVKALEERLGVSAAPMMAAPAGAASAAGAAPAEPGEEQTTFNVILSNTGANKIGVIKTVREINQTLGLKEAKDLVESAPKEILSGVNKATAQEAKQKLEAAGAQVELK